jgi:hypothetical protein
MKMRSALLALAGAAAIVACARPAAAADFSPYMAGLSVGGGVADFRSGTMRNNSSAAAAWNARLLVGTRTPVAFEAEYLGTAASERDSTANDPTLITTQVSGSARVNLTTWRIQPFLVGGAGWINLHSFGRDEAPIAATQWAHNDNGAVFPLGGGFSSYLGKHAMVDARFTYRLVTGASGFSDAGARPDMWNAQLNAGYAF